MSRAALCFLFLSFLPFPITAPSAAEDRDTRPPARGTPDATPATFDPTEHYDERMIEGWRVLVNRQLLAEAPETARDALRLFADQLHDITRRVPAVSVAKLRRITLWLELNEPHHSCAAYHPDEQWLRANGMNPAKAKCVEVANARNFVQWTREQPMMLLHELAHGYHDQFVEGGFQNPELLACYERAKRSGTYDTVLMHRGTKERAYAMTSPMEYFAESTEAFFGTNDFFPFVAAELAHHDPDISHLLAHLWNAPRQARVDARPLLVVVVADDEYKTEQTLPPFVEQHLAKTFRVEWVFSSKDDRNRLENLDTLKHADAAIFSVRRCVLTKEQMGLIRDYLKRGKPMVGIRTTSHAFAGRDGAAPEGRDEWRDFDREVLGTSYQGHYDPAPGGQPSTILAPGDAAATHPIMQGIETAGWTSAGTLYRSRDLKPAAQVLLVGRTRDVEPEPVAWTITNPWKGKVFYTSLGHSRDFENAAFNSMLSNAVLWSTDRPIPSPSPKPDPTENAAARAKVSYKPGQAPHEAVAQFELPDDLELEVVLSEPEITQPVHLSFDERGRMWVVEYRQYPHPAGLRVVSRDNYWRSVYDKVPPAPPNHFVGKDRVSIHEDTTGDGVFDKHSTFLEGLSIATSIACGRGGVWVLNPPYLLFYADQDRDDVPDGDPVVHLSGFGIEDTHSCANSLRFGPDGWLYGAQGSTVTCNVRRVGLDPPDKPGVQCQGQMLWRYHPESRQFEIYAEGGGNAFGLEIDAQGRFFSGHNGGDTRGFHYVQGAYLQKGFNKHGPLSNPFAFGYFPAMKHDRVPRFTHEFTIYDGGSLPEQYHGRMFAVAPLLHYLSISDVTPRGSTFATRDTGFITSSDPWFCPVDIVVGPDGALYLADWYDQQCSHTRNAQGEMDDTMGRVFRLKAHGGKPVRIDDFAGQSTAELVSLLTHPNIWVRQTVLRVLGDRRDPAAAPALEKLLFSSTDQAALEAVWALHQSVGLSDEVALRAMEHPNPYVRQWTVRLLGDDRRVSAPVAERLVKLAREEPNVEVRGQLACTARRLPVGDAMAIVGELVRHGSDTDDPQLPLLVWWAIETHCDQNVEEVFALLSDESVWSHRMMRAHLLARLMQRFASSGKRSDLIVCGRLLEAAPRGGVDPLMRGFEAAYRGRTPSHLPPELVRALRKTAGSAGLALRVRLQEEVAIVEALSAISTSDAKPEVREELIAVLGEIREPRAVGPLLDLIVEESNPGVLRSVLAALGNFGDEQIGTRLIAAHADLPPDVQPLAQNLLASRSTWSRALLQALEKGQLSVAELPASLAKKMLHHKSPDISAAVDRAWGSLLAESAASIQHERSRLEAVVAAQHGSPYEGKKLFRQHCGNCHTLFGEGGQVGPDLTAYNREQVGNILLHVVDPNAEIREGFETFLVITDDGRTLTGFLADQDAQSIVLRGVSGESTVLSRDEIEVMRATGQSLMPENLLKDFSDAQVRDLFAYLRATQPLND